VAAVAAVAATRLRPSTPALKKGLEHRSTIVLSYPQISNFERELPE
jgi:hypothetical protein